MSSNTHTSNAEAEQANTKKDRREAGLLRPATLKWVFGVVIFGLRVWRLMAKLGEWFL